MVKEKLRKALEDAVGYYNDGLSANDAVVKSASEHDLTADQADRVVESFNTAKTINYFDKNASDRTGKFDLASKKDVTLSLFGKLPEKKASSVLDPEGIQSFYYSDPDRSLNRKSLFAEKRAAFLDLMAKVAEEKWAHEYSDGSIHSMVSDAMSGIKAAEADVESAIGAIDSYLASARIKIASTLSRAPYGTSSDLADLFKAACPHDEVVKSISDECPVLKSATGGRYKSAFVVDTSPVDGILEEADEMAEFMKKRAEYVKKGEEFRKKEAELSSALLKDPSMSKLVQECSRPESMLHAPRSEVKSAASIPILGGGSLDSTDLTTVLPQIASRSDENEALRDEHRGAILADLLSSDPILQDADPRQVAAVYKSIIQSSPRVSLNKEVVRSVLRGAVNSIAFSPNDMKVLTDVDEGINKAYSLSRLDSSVKDSAS